MSICALTIKHLTVSYNQIPVLWNITACIPQGVLLGVIGPNGAGKTTLLKSILGLVKPEAGTISIFGSPHTHHKYNIAYVPQRSTVDWDFPTNALDVVLMGRYNAIGWFKRPGTADIDCALDALSQVGLTQHAHTPINQLSGGQQQRVFLARALVQDASLYLMDEPLIGVDVPTEKIIMRLLKKLTARGKTVLIVHHDLQTAREYFDWILMINTKRIACGPTPTVFTQASLCATYGKTPVNLICT